MTFFLQVGQGPTFVRGRWWPNTNCAIARLLGNREPLIATHLKLRLWTKVSTLDVRCGSARRLTPNRHPILTLPTVLDVVGFIGDFRYYEATATRSRDFA